MVASFTVPLHILRTGSLWGTGRKWGQFVTSQQASLEKRCHEEMTGYCLGRNPSLKNRASEIKALEVPPGCGDLTRLLHGSPEHWQPDGGSRPRRDCPSSQRAPGASHPWAQRLLRFLSELSAGCQSVFCSMHESRDGPKSFSSQCWLVFYQSDAS